MSYPTRAEGLGKYDNTFWYDTDCIYENAFVREIYRVCVSEREREREREREKEREWGKQTMSQ